jgi:hypothetical protein
VGSFKITLTVFVLLALLAGGIWYKAPSWLPEPGGEGPAALPPGVEPPVRMPPSEAIKQDAIRRLLTGEITLLEAGRRFRYANQHPDVTLAQLPRALSARPDDCHHCHEVVARVGRELTEAGDPARDAIMAELFQELPSLLHPPPPPLPPRIDPEDLPGRPAPGVRGDRENEEALFRYFGPAGPTGLDPQGFRPRSRPPGRGSLSRRAGEQTSGDAAPCS